MNILIRLKAAVRPFLSAWTFALVVISILLIGPFIDPLRSLFTGGGEIWNHIRTSVLSSYIQDTIVLAISVIVFSGLFGSISAWIVSRYSFPGRKVIEVLLVSPLAVPAYISAYAYEGIFGYFGPLYRFLEAVFPGLPLAWYPDISSMPGLIFVMSSALYPYVYILMKANFRSNISTALEAARNLGDGPFRQFFRLAMPLSRPVLAASLGIVLMEVLNEYGAVVYYGRNTLTTGIFRAWFGFYDLPAARKIGGILMVSVFVVLAVEQGLRRRRGYQNSGKRQINLERISPGPLKSTALAVLAILPAIFGIILPVLRLSTWAMREFPTANWGPILDGLAGSLGMGIAAAALITIFAVVISYARMHNRQAVLRGLSDLSLMGHSIPGAVIALGILGITAWFAAAGGRNLFAGGSIALLLFGYTVRFIAVSQRPISAEMEHRLRKMDEASRSLGGGSLRTLIFVHLPNLKQVLLASFALSFLELVRELPLTMILRPFNYNSLAVRSFELATNEMVQEASIPALILVLIGMGGIFLLRRGETNE